MRVITGLCSACSKPVSEQSGGIEQEKADLNIEQTFDNISLGRQGGKKYNV